MLVTKGEFWNEIYFEKHDWGNGLARIINEVVKRLPYKSRTFNREKKCWVYKNAKAYQDTLNEVYKNWLEGNPQPTPWDKLGQEFVVDKWLSQFKPSEAIKLSDDELTWENLLKRGYE